MSFRENDVRLLARLAHLELSDADTTRAAADLDRLLAYIEQLQAIDVSSVSEPEADPEDATTSRLRPDRARQGLTRELLMRGAPAASSGLFEVPRMVSRDAAPAAGPEATEPDGGGDPA